MGRHRVIIRVKFRLWVLRGKDFNSTCTFPHNRNYHIKKNRFAAKMKIKILKRKKVGTRIRIFIFMTATAFSSNGNAPFVAIIQIYLHVAFKIKWRKFLPKLREFQIWTDYKIPRVIIFFISAHLLALLTHQTIL